MSAERETSQGLKPPPDSLNEPERRLFDYWCAKRQGRNLPARADIDPADLGSLLPSLSLVDVERHGSRFRFRSRLIGTAIVEMFGRDITGRYADEIYQGAYLEQLDSLYRSIALSGEPALCSCEILVDPETPLQYRRFLLPLASDGATVDMLICLFTFDEDLPDKRWRLPAARSVWRVKS